MLYSGTMETTGLSGSLGLCSGQVFACVGAGGKTTLCWRLWNEFRAIHAPAIFTTTTHMLEPVLPPDSVLMLAAAPEPNRLRQILRSVSGLILAASRLPDRLMQIDTNPIVPARPVKLAGLAPDQMDELTQAWSDVTWLIEADGARGRDLKIPAAHEPAIPTHCDVVAIVAHLDAIGQPLDDTVAHRAEQLAAYLNTGTGDPIEADHLVRVLSDPNAGLKGVPRGARTIAVLNQRDETQPHPQADFVARGLLASGRYEHVVVASLRAPRPVLQVFSI